MIWRLVGWVDRWAWFTLPLWVRDAMWRREQADRRARAQAALSRLRKQAGVYTLRLCSDLGAGVVGLFIGGALWPFWWPVWSGWLFLAMGAVAGVLCSRLAWARWLA